MKPSHRHFLRDNLLGISLTLIGLLCMAAVTITSIERSSHPRFASAAGKALDGPDIDALRTLNKAYEEIAQSMTPSIVSIQSTQVVKTQMSPFFSDPFFRQFFGPQGQIPREQREHALGSGVLVSSDGYILTNNHVVRHATSIKVMLSDTRTFDAKVVGADPQTDVAVVKITGKNLPGPALLGDSSRLRVGDIVMAFGNPFALNFTVTRGSVSALNRSEGGIEDIQNFIQIDAPINPGNSGGALVNVDGQVVGINTAIVSGESGPEGEGGFIGIGFAIPINMAKHVMEDLIKNGKVTRGYLGASIKSLDEGVAHAFNVPDTSGAIIEDVTAGGPAAKAGLKNGDVVRKYNGQSVTDSGQLIAMVTETNPGTTVKLDILRNGQPMTIQVTLGERPADLSVQRRPRVSPYERHAARDNSSGSNSGDSPADRPAAGRARCGHQQPRTGEPGGPGGFAAWRRGRGNQSSSRKLGGGFPALGRRGEGRHAAAHQSTRERGLHRRFTER